MKNICKLTSSKTFFQNFGLFLGRFQDFLANSPQNVDNTHGAKCFAYSCIASVPFESEFQLFL